MRDVHLEAQRSDAGEVCQAPCHAVDAQSPSDARRAHLTRSWSVARRHPACRPTLWSSPTKLENSEEW